MTFILNIQLINANNRLKYDYFMRYAPSIHSLSTIL